MMRTTRLPIALGLTALLATSCGGDAGSVEARAPNRPRISHALADYVHSFAALGGLVATSHLVVEGRVASIVRGDTPTEGRPKTIDRLVVLEVDNVLYRGVASPRPQPGDRIEIDGEGWWEGRTRVIVNGVEWSEPGDRAFYFLTKGPCAGDPLTLINDQGRYLANGDDLYGTSSNDRLINDVLAMSVPEFRNAVADAAGRARAGEIQPQPAPAVRCSKK